LLYRIGQIIYTIKVSQFLVDLVCAGESNGKF
jgi:hypothetical protein